MMVSKLKEIKTRMDRIVEAEESAKAHNDKRIAKNTKGQLNDFELLQLHIQRALAHYREAIVEEYLHSRGLEWQEKLYEQDAYLSTYLYQHLINLYYEVGRVDPALVPPPVDQAA